MCNPKWKTPVWTGYILCDSSEAKNNLRQWEISTIIDKYRSEIN